MTKMMMDETNDYMKLVEFFKGNGLEYEDGEAENTNYVGAYELTHGGDLVGGVCIALEDGEYIIAGMAIDPVYRNLKLGKILLEKALDSIKSMGGDHVVLVAKAPEFYAKNGFAEIMREKLPRFLTCAKCPQFDKSCHPKVMQYNFNK